MEIRSPFKFLDSYTKEDRDIFFGREKETKEIYSRVFHSRILIVYGPSGSGKSSVIQCGLANTFQDSDWAPVNIRRGSDINQSLLQQIGKLALTRSSKNEKTFEKQLLKDLQSLYLDYFKPIYLIFDQFEELFIFGEKEEWEKFISGIKEVVDSDLPVKAIFVIRGEYLQYLSEFETSLPEFLENRFRIEKMTRHNAKLCITGPCAKSAIVVEDNFPENLLGRLSPEKTEIELTFLQVFLDKIYRTAIRSGNGEVTFKNSLLTSIGNVGDVLSEFLDEQLDQLPDKEKGLAVLKAFVSLDGTKKQVSAAEVLSFCHVLGYAIESSDLESIVQELVNRRILQDKDELGKYELRHDSLALRVYHKITQYERDRIEVRDFLNYAFNEHVRRGFLLNESDINYITPFQSKINLQEEIVAFIEKSKKAVRKSKRGKRQLYVGLSVIVLFLVVTLLFLNYSLVQKARADEMASFALRESGESKKQKQIAEEQKQLANRNANEAIKQKEEADRQRVNAEKQKVNAENLRQQALSQKQLAEAAKVNAEAARITAEKNEAESIRQSIRAETERRNAERLKMLSLAQALSIRSVQLQDTKLKCLLALQAFRYNQEYKGYDHQADIYNGLYWARKSKYGPDFNSQRIHAGPVRSIVTGRSALYSTGGDGKVFRFEIDNEKPRAKLLVSEANILNILCLDPEEKRLIAGRDDGQIVFYSLPDGTMIKTVRVHTSAIASMVLNSARSEIYSVAQDNAIIATNVLTYATRTVWQGTASPNALALDLQNNLFAGLSDGRVIKITAADGGTVEIKKLTNQNITQLAISSSGNLIAAGTESGLITIFAPDPASPDLTASGSKTAITSLQFSPDGRFLLSSSMDGFAQLFSTVNPIERPVVLTDHNSWVMGARFFNDGQNFVTGDALGTLRIFPVNMQALTKDFCNTLASGFSEYEWRQYVGDDIPYQNPCK